MSASLRGQVAVVTGASRGLGESIATRLLERGAHLVISARERGPLDEAVRVMKTGRPSAEQRVLGVRGDVSRAADVRRLVARALTITGNLDVLVCNAGVYGPLGLLDELDWPEWTRAIEINLLGTVLCCRAVLPVMRRQQAGKVITLSGGGATQPLPRISAYAASKAAVVRFTETLAHELAGSGIDVNSVAPGALNTRLLDAVLDAGPDRVGREFHARALRQKEDGGTPFERGADLVAFLASPDSDGITGRLISAVWDDWPALQSRREQLADSDVYTLRRIVPADRGWDER